MKKVILIIACIFYSGFIIGQWKVMTVKLPLVKCKQAAFYLLLDSIVVSEKECRYYRSDLMFSCEFNFNPNNQSEFGVHFESTTVKRALLCLNPIGYLECRGHFVFIYYNLPDSIFEKDAYKRRFSYQEYIRPLKFDKRKPPIIFGEDDSFSTWTYYYKGGKFYFIEHFDCNDKQ